ncbi:multiubiquitin domain-containing protein [Rhizobium sp. CCGE531]|uniref:multiubiquitin domain-containing protein n=1 Tax=Rhizobium sp. CCGE531 TaxID=2364271 RepID=UPI000EAA2787|nr:multiubiquitin domain-containing protein [Rhizobium sp. CCGE531]AYG70610.1 hypothetical protein CCGE531_32015 [Rhizobium sp. CCGE531]
MVWFVGPPERKIEGKPSGLWHLCAQSDEGGGFHVGCDHDHFSPAEALACREANVAIGSATGFPYKPAKIIVNRDEHEIDGKSVSHEQICQLAKQPAYVSVTYEGERRDDIQRSGFMYLGKLVKLEDGMIFNCIVTDSA